MVSTKLTNVNNASSHSQLVVSRRKVWVTQLYLGGRDEVQHELLNPALIPVRKAYLPPDDARDHFVAGQHFHGVAGMDESHHLSIGRAGAQHAGGDVAGQQ